MGNGLTARRTRRVTGVVVATGWIVACGSNGDSVFTGPDDSQSGVDASVAPPSQEPEFTFTGPAPSQDGSTPVATGQCQPKTCEQLGVNCGPAGDGCGGVVQCGTCNSPFTCGGGGVPSVCGGAPPCVPKTCDEVGVQCGPAGNGCGGVIQCGSCPVGQTCGGGGVASVCGSGGGGGDGGTTCVPKTCQTAGANCGQVADGCGGLTPNCGSCTAPQICGGGGVSNVCGGGVVCTPKTCQSVGANCGQVADGCGGLTPNCGTCTSPQICGGGGVANVCGGGNADAGSTPCTNLCLQQVRCDGGATTTLTGRVWAPSYGLGVAGNHLPIPGALVYVPNGQVQSLPSGVGSGSCDQCNAQATGAPLVSTTSNPDGTFTLQNVPVGTNIPLVIQLGRWRNQVTIPSVSACVTNTVQDGLVRLPRSQSESVASNIPHIAVTTGDADAIECVLYKMGIAKSEFTNSGGTGRIKIFQDNGARCGSRGGASDCSGRNFGMSASSLWGSQTELDKYDAVINGCRGGETLRNSADIKRLVAYADKGGRVFNTHYSYVWQIPDEADRNTNNNYVNPWAASATWPTRNGSYDFNYSSFNASTLFNLETSFPKGAQFAQWLNTTAVSALTPNSSSTASGLPVPSSPDVAVVESRHNVDSVNAPAQRWAYATASDPSTSGTPPGPGEQMILHYTFNTPWNVPSQNQCGRVLFSSFHVSLAGQGTNDVRFPAECGSSALTAQEKMLAYMLFDLTSCIAPDSGSQPPTCTPRNCQQLGINCGPAGDGCGNIIQCGTCPNGQTCGGGGTPNQCGGPTCTPKTCQEQGYDCGLASDGCGNTIDCGTCQTGACGGGGANKCGTSSCVPRTCNADAGIGCGPLADGCGGLVDCGTCPAGKTCSNNACISTGCVPRTCQQANANCGPVADGCGGLLDCGVCPTGQSCGSGGVANQCATTGPR